MHLPTSDISSVFASQNNIFAQILNFTFVFIAVMQILSEMNHKLLVFSSVNYQLFIFSAMTTNCKCLVQ